MKRATISLFLSRPRASLNYTSFKTSGPPSSIPRTEWSRQSLDFWMLSRSLSPCVDFRWLAFIVFTSVWWSTAAWSDDVLMMMAVFPVTLQWQTIISASHLLHLVCLFVSLSLAHSLSLSCVRDVHRSLSGSVSAYRFSAPLQWTAGTAACEPSQRNGTLFA